MNPETDIAIVCSCSRLDHVVWLTRDQYSDGTWSHYANVAIQTDNSLWRRLKMAWAVLWNRSPCKYVSASEIILEQKDLERIKKWCEEGLELDK